MAPNAEHLHILLASALLTLIQDIVRTISSRLEDTHPPTQAESVKKFPFSFHHTSDQFFIQSHTHQNGLHRLSARSKHYQVQISSRSNYSLARSPPDRDPFLAQKPHTLLSRQNLPHALGARPAYTGRSPSRCEISLRRPNRSI